MALAGKLTILREEQPEDMQFLVDLRNDLDTQAWSQTLPPDYTVYSGHGPETTIGFEVYANPFLATL